MSTCVTLSLLRFFWVHIADRVSAIRLFCLALTTSSGCGFQVDKYAEENALRASLGIKPLRDE